MLGQTILGKKNCKKNVQQIFLVQKCLSGKNVFGGKKILVEKCLVQKRFLVTKINFGW